jgi:NAD(P)-dependent dehydrogenase (short-subunit alcohol dehydrogenase family)
MTETLIVTGGSRGIGASTALLAARSGWRVVVNYQSNAVAADAVISSIRAEGGNAAMFKANVADEAAVLAMFDFAEEMFGPVTGLVNNAGILGQSSAFIDISLDRWRAIAEVNTVGTFLCAREAARRMSTSRGGRGGTIVNISSMAAVLGGAGEFIDYASSKGAVDTLTIGLAKELAPQGIRVNGVRPGLIDTEIHASSGDPDRAQRLSASVPMQRVGTSEEVAEAVVWLLSQKSAYVTGKFVDVSGGR